MSPSTPTFSPPRSHRYHRNLNEHRAPSKLKNRVAQLDRKRARRPSTDDTQKKFFLSTASYPRGPPSFPHFVKWRSRRRPRPRRRYAPPRASSGAPRPSSRPSLPLPPSRAVAAPRASRRVAADVDVIITAFRSVARSQAPSRRRRRPRVRVRVRVRVAPSRPRDVAAVPTPGRRPRGPARGAAGRDDPPRVRRRARGRKVRSPYTGPHTIPSA